MIHLGTKNGPVGRNGLSWMSLRSNWGPTGQQGMIRQGRNVEKLNMDGQTNVG